jgi:histidinol-phosphate phosphatase family protein
MLYNNSRQLDTLFLDRDGVLNLKIDNGYVLHPSDIEILPGIPEFLSWANEKFNQILVLTNQRCVGRHLLSLKDLEIINREINKITGSRIDKFYFCPHLEKDACKCRKPKDGMFLKAIEDYNIYLSASWMIGDSETDLIPAKKLGINTMFVSSMESSYADQHVNSTLDLLPFFKALQ